jgi:ornithine carbamoyltransferase
MRPPPLDRLRGCDFLGLADLDGRGIEALLDLAAAMKAGHDREQYLAGKTLGMLFAVPSTRTRISFQVAARQLGGHAEAYAPGDLQMSNHETLVDTAEVMGRYLDGIVVRMYDMARYGSGHAGLQTMAEHSSVPVINALDDQEHPCQVLADLLTVREQFGADWRRRKVVLTWAWAERQKSLGVTHSWLLAASALGLRLTLAFPPGFEPDPSYLALARQRAGAAGADLELVNDLEAASEGAAVIYAKSWMSLRGTKDDDRRLRAPLRDAWRVGERHFERADPDAVFMDCMPLIRGDEAEAAVVDGPRSIRYREAENRLHVQKAILASLI